MAPAVEGLYYCWTLLQPIIANLQLCGPPASLPTPPHPHQPLQGAASGGVDKCNSWCKLSFYPMIMVWLARLTFQPPQAPTPPPPSRLRGIELNRRRRCLSAAGEIIADIHARLSRLVAERTSFPCRLCSRAGCDSVSLHFFISFFFSLSFFFLGARFICTSPGNVTLQRNSQLEPCVCHIAENDWISEKAAVKKMWSSICGHQSLLFFFE